MTKKSVVLILAVLLGAAGAQSQTRPRESLRGLHGVFLYVHPVGKEVETGGLTTSQVQKAAEKALHDAGIQVFSEPQPEDGSTNLVISIDTVKYSEAAYLYSVSVSLLQEARLARQPEAGTFPAQTWNTLALGITGTNRMDLILEPVRFKINEFIRDFKTANDASSKKGH